MMNIEEKQWIGLSIQMDGEVTIVRYSDMQVEQLADLFYAALLKIPWCKEAMQIALDNVKSGNE